MDSWLDGWMAVWMIDGILVRGQTIEVWMGMDGDDTQYPVMMKEQKV